MRIHKSNVRSFLSFSLNSRTQRHPLTSSYLSTQCLRSLSDGSSLMNGHRPSKPTCIFTSFTTFRLLSTITTADDKTPDEPFQISVVSDEEVEPIDLWEEEEETEPEMGDGGDGGGIVLQNCIWGKQALSIANDILQEFGPEMNLFAFKTSPRGYIYIRIDKLPNEYGCPSMDEIESFSRKYKKKLDEAGARGELPDDLALEVSSPSAERLLKVPDDLIRFKDMPMNVTYIDDLNTKDGVFYMESIDNESESCVWKLADVKENRDPSAKGRPLSRKLKDWRLKLSYTSCKKVTLYLDY